MPIFCRCCRSGNCDRFRYASLSWFSAFSSTAIRCVVFGRAKDFCSEAGVAESAPEEPQSKDSSIVVDAIAIAAMKRVLVPVLLLVAIAIACSGVLCFQSDELPEDAEEWGLVGDSAAPVIKTKVVDKTEAEYNDGVLSPGKPGRKASRGAAGAKKISFPLEHSLGDGKFEQIGTFTGILRTSGQDSGQERQAITKLRLLRNAMTKTGKQAFEDLVKNDGFYTIRIPANLIQPRHKHVLASVKARCLAAANFKERFDLFMEQGNLIGVGYSPIGDCSYPRPQVFPKDWAFNTLIVAKGNEIAPRLGPRFEEAVPLRAGEKGLEGEEGVKVIVEKTFWQKYWMYIVPFGFIVINALSQLANLPEEGQAGQGGPAITAPTQRTGGSGSGRTRR